MRTSALGLSTLLLLGCSASASPAASEAGGDGGSAVCATPGACAPAADGGASEGDAGGRGDGAALDSATVPDARNHHEGGAARDAGDGGTAGYFPIGVFMQQPDEPAAGGVDNAGALASIGVNVVVDWTGSAADLTSGRTHDLLERWRATGIGVYWDPISFGGPGQAAALGYLGMHPEHGATVLGWNTIDDESDGKYNADAYHAPLDVLAEGNATRAADPSRPVYANYNGPMIRNQPQAFYHPETVTPQSATTGAYAGDMAAYAQAVNRVSFDDYEFTRANFVSDDPALETDSHGQLIYYGGIWVYGRDVDGLRANLQATNPGCPVMPIIEDANPWEVGSYAQGVAGPTPSQIESIVWMTLVHGARGILYFGHTFGSDPAAPQSDHSLTDANQPGITEKMSSLAALHGRIASLGAVLASPALGAIAVGNADPQTDGRELLPPGYALTSSTSVPVDSMVRRLDGVTYWFAIASGNETLMSSGATTAAFESPSAAGRTITVRDESRTIVADAKGRWSDAFSPYQAHIYVW